MSTQIPETFLDLIEGPVVVALATIMPSGQPQVTPVWCDYADGFVRINTARGRQKDRNLSARSQVTILAIDPQNPYRWIEVRGQVEDMTEDGAVDHINTLSKLYTGNADYYGGSAQRRASETRVLIRIRPTHVNTSR